MGEYILDNLISLLCFYMTAQSKTGHSLPIPYGDVIVVGGGGVEVLRDGPSKVLRVRVKV